MDTVDPTLVQNLVLQVTWLKWLAAGWVFIAVCFLLVFVWALWVVAKRLREVMDMHQAESFRFEAAEFLERDQLEELVRYVQLRLKSHPNHTDAHWYLALAYYHKGLWHDSKRAFQRVVELAPNWRDSVEPYLDELEERIRESGPKLVQ